MNTKQIFEQHSKLQQELEERLFRIAEIYDSVDEIEGRFLIFLLSAYSTVDWSVHDGYIAATFEYIDSYDGFDQHETVRIPDSWFEMLDDELAEACKNDIEYRAELEHKTFINRLKSDAEDNGYKLVKV